ncbi:F-BAR domain only protein 2-like, partial [Antrostomus carolinensis]|uniref:F-BAR domain only protein 2-like n=1 Tax=Antrostomus carolinensis TaxID=279965 RepID=UPI0010A980CD
GERNNGFDVLYHNMKHGHLSTKDLADFIRERATIEEAYSRSMAKLAKSASNYTQLGTFAPVWDVFKTSTEKLASCHLDLVRRLQELIKEVHKYGDEQIKAYKKTKEDVSGTLEAVQNIQSITQALQKSKENYNAKCVEQERLKKEGATQREIDKAAVKSKKATDTYKLYVEKYAAFKSDFEQKMTETAQKFQDIEEMHLLRMKEIIESLSNTIKETHLQIGEVHEEFINNMTNTTVESLIQKFAESKGTGKERPVKIKKEKYEKLLPHEIETAWKYELMFFLDLLWEIGRIISNVFEEMVEEPTRREELLDLVLINKERLVEEVKVGGRLGCSDYEIVEFRITCSGHRATSRTAALDFKRANFGLFMELLGEIPWDRALDGRGAQESWLIFKHHFLQAQDQSILKSKKSSRRATTSAWLSRELLDKLKWKKEVYRTWKKGLTTWEEYKNVVRGCGDTSRKDKASLELKLTREVKDNKKGFFKNTGGERKTRGNVGPLLNE